jgi:hypothetical protein
VATLLTDPETTQIALVEVGFTPPSGTGVDPHSAAFIRAASGGGYPVRTTATTDPNRLVLWVGPADPTRNPGFMLPGDIWFQQG